MSRQLSPQKILITSYENPDVDGLACAFAYAEFLQQKGIDAVAGIFGKPHREAQFVLDTFSISQPRAAGPLCADYENVILVDASDVASLLDPIKPANVVEIIDHRQVHEAHAFSNARIQIERVGACATLIAEKYVHEQRSISKEAGALLYSAIISNTLNFQAPLTTERDKHMAVWLKEQFVLPEQYVEKMFQYKSSFTEPLRDILLADFKAFTFGATTVGIAQLEIVDVDGFIASRLGETKQLLAELKQEKHVDHIFLNCIDLVSAYNTFVACDGAIREILAKILAVSFDGVIGKSNSIIMRKEIVPLLEHFFTQT